MKGFFRILRWTVIGAVTLVLLVVAVILAINGHDEILSDTAQRWLTAFGGARPPGNGAAALWAFDAPKGVDALVVGRANLAAIEGIGHDNALRQDWHFQRPYQPEHFQIPLQLGCIDPASACIRAAVTQAELVRRLASEQEARLERIRAIARAPAWQEIAPRAELGAPTPPIDDLLSAYSLSLDLAAVEISSGQIEEGVALLESDLTAARRMVAHSESTLLRDAALGMVRRTYLAYSEILSQSQADRPAVVRLANSLEQHARDLADLELDLRPVLHDQARRTLQLDESLTHPQVPSGASLTDAMLLHATPLLYLPHATFNATAELFEIEAPLLNVSPKAYATSLPEYQGRFEKARAAIAEQDMSALYNPLGRILASQTPPLFELVARASDVTALGRAVLAKAELMSHAARFADAATALAILAPSEFDPYTGQPFAWDPGDAAIVLTQRSGRAVTKIAVPLT